MTFHIRHLSKYQIKYVRKLLYRYNNLRIYFITTNLILFCGLCLMNTKLERRNMIALIELNLSKNGTA